MNKVNAIIVLVLFLAHSASTQAKEGIFLFDGDSISLYNSETDIKDADLSKKIMKAADPTKNENLTVSNDLRAQILKDLKIEESDYVYIKFYGKTETSSSKVSDLKLTVVSNFIGTDAPNIGDIVLEIPKTKDRGVVAVGKTNPFTEKVRFNRVMPAKGIYWINPTISFIEEISRTQQEEEEYKKNEVPNGIYYLKLQIDKKEPELINSYNTQNDNFSHIAEVYGGDIFSDGSTLIRVRGFSSCGLIIVVKDKVKKVIKPLCGEVGC